MKGIVFTEFLEMVERRFSPELADRILTDANPGSGGAYTAVGTYDHRELIQLVSHLSTQTGLPGPDLVREFGRHLFTRFVALYPHFFKGIDNSFDLLSTIENQIHVEVRKLYPEAELPSFDCTRVGSDELRMVYRSSRPFADLAEGLILGCIEHYRESIQIERQSLADGSPTAVQFTLRRATSRA